MSDKERLDFEAQLDTDPSLVEELELERVIQDAVQDAGVLNWETEIKSNLSEIKRTSKIKKVALFSTGVILISSIAGYLLNNNVSFLDQIDQGEIKEEVVVVQSSNEVETEQVIELAEAVKQSSEKQQIIEPKQIENKSDNKIDEITVATESNDSSTIAVEEDHVTIQEVEVNTTVDKKIEVDVPDDLEVEKLCEGKEFKLSITTSPTCQDKEEGEIVINDASLDAKNNVYQLKHTYGETLWQSKTTFESLPTDDYQLIVRDNNNCKITYDDFITIEEQQCFVPEKGFNPQLETWLYEGSWEDEVTLIIYNKAHQVVLEKQIGNSFEWDGTNMQGVLVPVGQYLYMIKENENINGYVTVLY